MANVQADRPTKAGERQGIVKKRLAAFAGMVRRIVGLRPSAERMCREFASAFPGKCIVCAYHRFGLREGLTREPSPAPHDCIEKQSNDSITGGGTPYRGCTGSALALAKQFHDTYERLAPSFGYETRPETRDFDPRLR